MPRLIDLTGKRFGRWAVLCRTKNKKRHTAWLCKCDCGKLTAVKSESLRTGRSRSCGCWNVEKFTARNTKHNGHSLKEYSVWSAMKDRCFNSKNIHFKNYGGRGITVCDEWTRSFSTFIYDMGLCPREGFTLERTDNEKGYNSYNCVWASRVVQSNNRRSNVLFTYKGDTKNIKQWSLVTGINYSTLRHRLKSSAWSVEAALTTPVMR